MGAVLAAEHLKGECGRCPIGGEPCCDVSVERLQVPSKLKKGAGVRSEDFRPGRSSGSSNHPAVSKRGISWRKGRSTLSAGKNLFHLPQTLPDPDFTAMTFRWMRPAIRCRKTIEQRVLRPFVVTRAS